MKKASSLLALAGTLMGLASVPAYGGRTTVEEPCKVSVTAKNRCVSVPEPSSVVQLAAGLAVVGGLAVVLRRKRRAQN